MLENKQGSHFLAWKLRLQDFCSTLLTLENEAIFFNFWLFASLCIYALETSCFGSKKTWDSSTVSHISNDVYIIIIEKQKPSKNWQRRWAVHRQAVRLAFSVSPVTELAQSVSQSAKSGLGLVSNQLSKLSDDETRYLKLASFARIKIVIFTREYK